MLFPHVTQAFWQALSAASEFGLLIVAAFGLRQLSLAKRGLQLNGELARKAALRESYRLAAEQCSAYLRDLIPLINKCDRELAALGLGSFLDSFTVEVRADSISLKPPNPLPPNFSETFISPEFIQATLPVANALEAFAVMFTSRVAAESVAFSSIGLTFCHSVKQHAPMMIPMAGSADQPGPFKNVLQLFVIWQSRLNDIELRRQQEALSKQLLKVRDIKIHPLGT